MEHSTSGDVKVTYEQMVLARRRNGAFPAYFDLVGEEAGEAGQARPLPAQSTASRRRTYADGELDVFAAEQYFKGAMDCEYMEAEEAAAVPVETTATAARPAVAVSKPGWTRASAASSGSRASANSQTELLRDPRRRRPGYRSKKCCMQVGVLLRSCSGKRAVGVGGGANAKEAAASREPAASTIEWYRDLRLEKSGLGPAGDGSHGVVAGIPPNLNLAVAKVAAIGREMIREEKAVEYTSASFRRSFTLLAPVKVTVPAKGGGCVDADADGGNGDEEDEVGSESSSDLFEIKSLMIDECPYEPSEASIQWSVVTASASAGDASVASGRAGSGAGSAGRGPATSVAVRQHRDRPVGLLTGCVSHGAVDVSAMAAVRRFPDAPVRRRVDGGFQKAQSAPS